MNGLILMILLNIMKGADPVTNQPLSYLSGFNMIGE